MDIETLLPFAIVAFIAFFIGVFAGVWTCILFPPQSDDHSHPES